MTLHVAERPTRRMSGGDARGARSRLSEAQRQMLSCCRRAFMAMSNEPEYMDGEYLYPCIQVAHNRVLLISSDHRPDIVAMAMFRDDGTPVHFEDWRTGEVFPSLA